MDDMRLRAHNFAISFVGSMLNHYSASDLEDAYSDIVDPDKSADLLDIYVNVYNAALKKLQNRA